MQGGHGYYGGYGYGGGGYGYDAGGGGYYSTGGGYPAAASYADPQEAHELFPAPLNGHVEFQPSETCPKNYVIFDQTSTQSRVVFHPSLEHDLRDGGGSSSGHDYYYGSGGAYRDKDDNNSSNDDDSCSVVRQEEEIDALLSADDDLLQDGADDDDAASTGRAPGYRDDNNDDEGSSPDSSGYYGAGKPRPAKKGRVRKMMRTLKGIIPGGSQMDTPAALDEAVRYLKSLKLEAKKLGVRGAGGSDS